MSASLELGDIFRAAGPAWRAAHTGRLPLQQLKVMSAVEHCRGLRGLWTLADRL